MNLQALELYDQFMKKGSVDDYLHLDKPTREGFDALCGLHNAIIGLEKHLDGYSKCNIYFAMDVLSQTDTPIHPSFTKRLLILGSKNKTGKPVNPCIHIERARCAGIIYGIMESGGKKFFGDNASNASNIKHYINNIFHVGGCDVENAFKQLTKPEVESFKYCRKTAKEWMLAVIRAHIGEGIELQPPTVKAAARWELSFFLSGVPNFRVVTAQTLLEFKLILENSQ